MPGCDESHLFMGGYLYEKYGKISDTNIDFKRLFPVEDKSSKKMARAVNWNL